MKKRIATMVLLLLCASLAACGEKEETTVTGGWTLTAGETAVQLPEEAQDAFDKASDSKLTPIALVSEQVVAGKNYLVLCAEDGAYRMVKSGAAMGVGTAVAGLTGFWAAIPVTMGVRALFDRYRSKTLTGHRVQGRIKRLEELNKFIRRGMKEEESEEEPLLQGEPLEAPGHVE